MIYGSLFTWGLLGFLLCLSAFFSSSETALFSLTKAKEKRAGERARQVMENPRDLLIAVLFSNLVVNLLYFLTAAQLGKDDKGKVIAAVGALVALLIFGEILPKTIGLSASVTISRLTALPLMGVIAITSPVRSVMGQLLEWTGGMLGEHGVAEPHLRPGDLSKLFEQSAEHGHLLYSEAELLVEIAELELINVRQIMTPRVDALFLELDGSNRKEVENAAIKKRLARLPVIDGQPDKIVGQVRVRDLLIHPDREPKSLVMPVRFVPEVASTLDLLHSLRNLQAAEAVVVDEWGGTAGIVNIEDIFEELVGDLRVEGESREISVVPLGEGNYRVAGSLSMHDWNDVFGFQVVPKEYETVGGFVTALLGRIPRAGDEVRWGDLVLEVHDVRGRRVQTVDMSVHEGEDLQHRGVRK
ncbi:MAG: hemolysin family protein [Planctomycetota bacterium]|nr:hemolysin family protein [Planctomycetota bacterium]MDG2142652.1 hemolysin family protein [Planctomycetota bacterium]